MHECFAWPNICVGVFKNKKYFNSPLLFQLNVVNLDEINFSVQRLIF